MTQVEQDTPVLVVGGGIVGLSAALFLQHQGTPFILVEREKAASPLPRARGWAVRSMELFRTLGLQAAIEEASQKAWEQGVFGGGRRGASMLASSALEIPDTKVLTGADPSPCKMVACPQTAVEPILREALEQRGGDVRFGCELLAFEQDNHAVHVTVREATGAEKVIHARYVIAADGSRGGVRHKLNIDRHGSSAAGHYLNVFFEADLAERMRDRTFSQCEVENDKVKGLFLSMNNTTKWSFHLLYDAEKDQPETWPEDKLTELLHSAIGDDVPLHIHHRGTWTAADRVSDQYRDGRIFLAGDTAHIMPPWGGLNGNTGIADAHNLAWKLAHVVAGQARPELLESYEAERRPVALRNAGQAQLRSDFDLRFGVKTDANQIHYTQLRDGGELLMRYRYSTDDTVDVLHGQVGTRFPHAWIEKDGKQVSTLDLFGKGMVKLGGPIAEAGGVLRVGKEFRFMDKDMDWHTLTGSSDAAVLQVRPDGFVAASEGNEVSNS